MALRCGYFDSEITGTDEEGMPIFDRAETSELFRLFFAKLVSNGVLASPGNCFQVIAGDGLTVKVEPGFGMVNGAFAYDNAEETHALETAPTQYSRIDRVVLRANYAERLCEIIIKTGTAASTPTAPELLQPASGDYYELGLATITINANQTIITQSAITDTRPDSSVCGYITQLIDHLDTETFYAQFNAFYEEFVSKSNASYDKFEDMAKNAYADFTAAINDYISGLKSKGDSDLSDITASMAEFERTSKNTFNTWFATIKGTLSDDAAGKLEAQAADQEERMQLLEYETTHNHFIAPILDDDGNPILDSAGNAIIGEHRYMLM